MAGNAKDCLGVALILFLLGVIGAGTLYRLKVEKDYPNPVTYCTEHINGHIVLLMDQTDELSERSKKGLQRTIETVSSSLLEGEKLSIFRIEDDSDKQMVPLYDACKPPDVNGLMANVILAQKHIAEFSSSMKGLAANTANATGSEFSPIMETLSVVTRDIFQQQDAGRKEIVIFSDMLQNSPRCTDYPRKKSQFQLSECPDWPDMSGITVKINYVLRQKYASLQTSAHKERWIERIERAGGKVQLLEEY